MEKIISFLIMFGAAALFEFVKERKKKAGSSRAATDRPGKSVNHLPGNLTQLLNARIPNTSETPTASVPLPYSSDRTTITDTPRGKRPFLPGESHHRPIVVPKQHEEDEPMELITIPELPENTDQTDNMSSSPNEEHYLRWRRAIIDTAILNPPYISSTEK